MANDETLKSGEEAKAQSLEQLLAAVKQLEKENSELRAAVQEHVVRRLPDTRRAITHKFDIVGHEGYLIVGLFEDGSPGEVFIVMAKEGSTVGGLTDTIGMLLSFALKSGVSLELMVEKLSGTRFEPSGFTKNPDIPIAKSITDYLMRWLAVQFIPGYLEANTAVAQQRELRLTVRPLLPTGVSPERDSGVTNVPSCETCGSIPVENGTVWQCINCGARMPRVITA